MDEKKRKARDILKSVDQLVKANNLDQAMREVTKAREIDPTNVYAFAYEERIKELFAQIQKKKSGAVGEARGSVTSKRGQIPQDDTGQQNHERKDIYGVRVPTIYEEFKKVASPGKEGVSSVQSAKASSEALDTYKRALLLAWSDGQKTEEEKRDLEDLRQSLSITSEEHATLERQAKLECYILMLKYVRQSSTTNIDAEASLAELRRSFDISSSDQMHIEKDLDGRKATGTRKRTIAVIDDEPQILGLLKTVLEVAGFNVAEFLTSDSAFDFLKNDKVDMIVCDINLETSTMDGFTFYEKLRELNHLKHIPFAFLTGLNDNVLIRAGKELGVDDFLFKPIAPEDLILAIRGRLKRFEQLSLH